MSSNENEQLSRRIFALRKSDQHLEAYQISAHYLAEPHEKTADPWLLRALCWSLIDALKAPVGSPLSYHADEAIKLLAQLPINTLPKTDEPTIVYRSILLYGFGNPSALSKANKYEEALRGYLHFCQVFDPNPTIQSQISYCIGYFIKQCLDSEKPEFFLKPIKQALELACRCLQAETKARHFVLAMALKFAKSDFQTVNKFNFPNFLRLWLGEGFPASFWQPETYNGKTFEPLAIRALQLAAKQIKTLQDPNLAYDYIPDLEQAIEIAPAHNQWLIYHLASLLLLTDSREKAQNYLLQSVKRNATHGWAWSALGEFLLEVEPEKAISCFGKAIDIERDEQFSLKARKRLLVLFIATKELARAKFEALKIVQLYEEHDWNIKPKLEEQIEALEDINPISEQEQLAFYKHCSQIADAFLFSDLPEHHAIVTNVFTNQKGKQRMTLFIETLGVLNFPGSQIQPALRRPGTWLTVKCSEEQPIQLLKIEQTTPRPSLFGQQPWAVARLNKQDALLLSEEKNLITWGKKTLPSQVKVGDLLTMTPNGHWRTADQEESPLVRIFQGKLKLLTAGFGFVDDIYINADLVNDQHLQNGENVIGKAIMSFNKKKESWGWSAININCHNT